MNHFAPTPDLTIGLKSILFDEIIRRPASCMFHGVLCSGSRDSLAFSFSTSIRLAFFSTHLFAVLFTIDDQTVVLLSFIHWKAVPKTTQVIIRLFEHFNWNRLVSIFFDS